jgi:hypothetical protein
MSSGLYTRRPAAGLWLAGLALLGLMLALSAQGTAAGPAAAITPTPTPAGQAELRLLLPDLITLAPFDLRIAGNPDTGRKILRFANAVANVGEGALELRGTWQEDVSGFQVSQQLYGSHGEVLAEPILPVIIYHPEHGHWHLDGFARYELWSTTHAGQLLDIVSVSGKISYCLIDTDRLTAPEGSRRGYANCSASRQGMSAGWADTYKSHLAGQWVDISGLPDGYYVLRSVADPHNHLREMDDDNNWAVVTVRIEGNQVSLAPEIDLDWSRVGGSLVPE